MHIALHQKSPLTEAHFDRWVELWKMSVQHFFIGPKAEEAINRAELMKELMLVKIRASENRLNLF